MQRLVKILNIRLYRANIKLCKMSIVGFIINVHSDRRCFRINLILALTVFVRVYGLVPTWSNVEVNIRRPLATPLADDVQILVVINTIRLWKPIVIIFFLARPEAFISAHFFWKIRHIIKVMPVDPVHDLRTHDNIDIPWNWLLLGTIHIVPVRFDRQLELILV
jgi:hypothetical protein